MAWLVNAEGIITPSTKSELQACEARVAEAKAELERAQASHLSRSVFYQRLALIGDLLGADLDDGETIAALHLALLARRRTAASS